MGDMTCDGRMLRMFASPTDIKLFCSTEVSDLVVPQDSLQDFQNAHKLHGSRPITYHGVSRIWSALPILLKATESTADVAADGPKLDASVANGKRVIHV